MNSNQKLNANIVYTGTIAKAISSFILNLEKNQSQPQSFLSKKYINQNTGDIIVYIHIYIPLIISTNHRVIINIAYINTNNTSNSIFTITSHKVLDTFLVVSAEATDLSKSSIASKDNIQ
ncbi:hypothetical protein HOF65_02340 [bacterium]|jgi:hypothetical protein|nr:hypothetical protein [bacterium]MBT3852839.1 hypothetical protein [bacterium]MBT4632565.1 hypothetical protein [bacterium]MBT6779197.1 hypothetical protein [bacterium]